MQANVTSRFSSGRSTELIASGIPSLDSVLGGGLPLGSIALILEDELGAYSDMFLQAYIAQGLVHNDSVFLASDANIDSFFKTLPAPVESKFEDQAGDKHNEPMTIAWRYGSSISPRETKQLSLSNNFSFKNRIPERFLKEEKLHSLSTVNSSVENLLEIVLETIKTLARDHYLKAQKSNEKSHLRIGLQHLGSILWKIPQNAIPNFLFKLRCFIAQYSTSVCITLPAALFTDSKVVLRCCQISDVVFGLVVIDAKSNPLYTEYNGLFQLRKLAPKNSLTPLAEISDDWAFKLIQKRLLVERITLPPELDTSTQREQVKEPLCGSLKKTLDF